MQRRKLGDLEVAAIGLGCATMTPFYGEPDPAEAIAPSSAPPNSASICWIPRTRMARDATRNSSRACSRAIATDT